ncbi:Hypothetical predicted protein [Pelobates cultripes]|uniref:Uncharacterized protein n=1 Tax=Pelobates cultripes TaxID=61616 RepID=A0AAD1SI26_PELCU|nr:Hypothetical predicted protein [Pelobates cultripes]
MADGGTATASTEGDHSVLTTCYHRGSLRALKPPRNSPGTYKLTNENHHSQHFLHMPISQRQPQKGTLQASSTNDQGWKNKQNTQLYPLTAWCYSPRQYIKARKTWQTYPTTGTLGTSGIHGVISRDSPHTWAWNTTRLPQALRWAGADGDPSRS